MEEHRLLSMISHGTDGSDGIEDGIHLRWAFNYKLGFPPQGFVLSRRKSDLDKKICFDFTYIRPMLHNSIIFNYTSFLPFNEFSCSLVGNSDDLKVKKVKAGKRHEQVLSINSVCDISFSKKMCHIEVEYSSPNGVKFEIKAHDDQNIVWEKIVEVHQKDSKILSIRSYALNHLSVNILPKVSNSSSAGSKEKQSQKALETAGETQLMLLQKQKNYLIIHRICFWMCDENGKHPWEVINDRCGFGLPHGQSKPTSYIQKHHQDKCDLDWAIAACRLGPRNQCNVKERDFQDLKEVISRMNNEGIKIPVGWNIMTHTDESPVCPEDEEDAPNLQIAPYDLLLMQSQNPDIARILGLYWVDKDVENGINYDYKIEAYWPEKPRSLWKLEHELTFETYPIGKLFYPLFHLDNFLSEGPIPRIDKFIFKGPAPRILAYESEIGRVKQGLSFNYPNESEINIYLVQPMSEIQLFLSQLGLNTFVIAFTQDGGSFNYVDKNVLTDKEGVIAVYSKADKPINLLIIKGKGVILQRIHYDEEYLPYGKQHFIICGVKKSVPGPLQAPTGLQAVCMQEGVTRKRDCVSKYYRFAAGLRWNILQNENSQLLSHAPVSYHVKRKTPRGVESIVTDNPIFVVQNDDDLNDDSENIAETLKIKRQQFFIDPVEEKGEYTYQVAGVDLFGRQTPFSLPITIPLKPPPPPHPTDVYAKYLDKDAYVPDKDLFLDPNLSPAEQQWLKTKQESAIVVSWKWNKEHQRQSPDALSFNVHLKHGWLNLLQGAITDVLVTENNVIKVKTDIEEDISAKTLVGEWIRQGKIIYRISDNTKSSSSVPLELTLDMPPDYLDLPDDEILPKEDVAFTLPITRLQQQQNSSDQPELSAGIDYRDSANWDSLIKNQIISVPSQTKYEIYITAPPFPNPPFNSDVGLHEENKIRYAQIAISTVTEEGEGSVSPPATIMAIDRRQPAPKNFADASSLKASPADFHGKSTFVLRWDKPQDPGIKFYIYRALDETLFSVYWSLHPEIPTLNSSQGEIFPTEWEVEQRQQICDELNALKSFNHDSDGQKLAKERFNNLSNNTLRVLANLMILESAYAKLNDKPTRQEDPQDVTQLFYEDKTLNGLGDNKYFYRIRSINEISNLGAFGLATLPVEIPRIPPLQAPVITQVSGGDRQITIKWLLDKDPTLVQYKIFRSETKDRARDIRLMTLVKTIEVAADPSQREKYIDRSDGPITGLKEYWYRIVAVTANSISLPSEAIVSQASYLNPPAIPTEITSAWESSEGENKIVLTWKCEDEDANISFKIERRIKNMTFWAVREESIKPEKVESKKYRYLDTKVNPSKTYQYRFFSRDPGGNMSNPTESHDVPPSLQPS